MYYFQKRPELLDLTQYIEYESDVWNLPRQDGWTPKKYMIEAFEPYLGNWILVDWLMFDSEYDDRDKYKYCPLFENDRFAGLDIDIDDFNSEEYFSVPNGEILEISLAALLELPHWVIKFLDIYCREWKNPEFYSEKDREYLQHVLESMEDGYDYERNKRMFGLALLRIPHMIRGHKEVVWSTLTGSTAEGLTDDLYRSVLSCYNHGLMIIVYDYCRVNSYTASDFEELWALIQESNLTCLPIDQFPIDQFHKLMDLEPKSFVNFLAY